MAKKSKENRSYSVEMSGLYFAHSDKGSELKKYVEQFNIDDEIIKETGVKSSFARFWAPEYMPDKYPDYIALSTFFVTNCSADDGEPVTNIELMNHVMILEHIDEEGYDIDVELYFDDDELREAIRTIEDDPTGFASQQDLLSKRRGQTVNVKSAMMRLNPPKTADKKTPVASTATKGKGKKDDDLGV